MGKFREKICIFPSILRTFFCQNGKMFSGKKSHFLKMLEKIHFFSQNFPMIFPSVGTDKWAFEQPIGHEVQINVYFYGVFFH